jgi:hypothetical protein
LWSIYFSVIIVKKKQCITAVGTHHTVVLSVNKNIGIRNTSEYVVENGEHLLMQCHISHARCTLFVFHMIIYCLLIRTFSLTFYCLHFLMTTKQQNYCLYLYELLNWFYFLEIITPCIFHYQTVSAVFFFFFYLLLFSYAKTQWIIICSVQFSLQIFASKYILLWNVYHYYLKKKWLSKPRHVLSLKRNVIEKKSL